MDKQPATEGHEEGTQDSEHHAQVVTLAKAVREGHCSAEDGDQVADDKDDSHISIFLYCFLDSVNIYVGRNHVDSCD